MDKDLTGKVALVTGASAGIGLSLAKKLVARGARVALVARTPSKLEEVAAELGIGKAYVFPLDVSDVAALAKLPDAIVDKLGRLDIVVNNAGTNHRGGVDEVDSSDLVGILTTNLVAPVVLIKASLPHLKRGSVIVNIASLAGMVPLPHEAAYCASEGNRGVLGLAGPRGYRLLRRRKDRA
jgi:NAD(P)-dependent dehydrogenase (short-subunit alcohol dehydrogenase family)